MVVLAKLRELYQANFTFEMASSGSLADRITKPSTLDASSSTFKPQSSAMSEAPKDSWAEQVASPVGDSKESGLDQAQTDGTVEPLGGSGLHDATYEVEVKLSDIQGDESSPLFSFNTFEQLGM